MAYHKATTFVSPEMQHQMHSNLQWFLLDIPVVPVLLIFHTLFASVKVYELTPVRTFWLKSLILTAFAAFGGSTLAAMLSARPAPLFTSASDVMCLYLVASWFLVQHRLVRLLLNSRVGMTVLSFGANAARARAIFRFMDEYMTRFPRCVSGAILLGGLAGAGGRLFVSLENIVQRGFAAPSEFSAPGWAFKSSFVAASAYYILVDDHDVFFDMGFPSHWLLDKSLAQYYISATLCFHAALETLLGRQFNPLYVFERVLYAITGLRQGVKMDMFDHSISSTLSDDVSDAPEPVDTSNDNVQRPASDRPNAPGLRRRRRR